MRIGGCGALCALALLSLSGTVALAAAPPFTAHGSAEQVYVTGLGSQQRAMLQNASGRTIQTANADSLGGLIFRNVKPGHGYRVRAAPGGPSSGPVTVLSNAPTPPSTSVYNQSIPSSGYGYLTTRDGTKLAIDVHPPQDASTAMTSSRRSLASRGSPTTRWG